MLITYIRHAESELNRQGIMQGIDNPDLSSRGTRQAAALAGRLREVRNVRIYSSPLQRALQTARTVASRLATDITVIDDLKELDVGVFSLLTWDQAKERHPALFKNPGVTFWKLVREDAIPGQEPYASVVERTERALTAIQAGTGDRLPMVFGHGGCMRIFIAEQLGFKLVRDGIRIDNTAVTRFTYQNGLATFHGINDTHHLAPSGPASMLV